MIVFQYSFLFSKWSFAKPKQLPTCFFIDMIVCEVWKIRSRCREILNWFDHSGGFKIILNSFWFIIGSFLILFSKCLWDRKPIFRGAPDFGKLTVVPYSLNLRIIEPTVENGTFTCVEISLHDIPSEWNSIIFFRRCSDTSFSLGMIIDYFQVTVCNDGSHLRQTA